MLNQTAQTAKRSPEFAACYQTIAKKRRKKIATIAISRKQLTRAWHLLATQASTPAVSAVPTGPDGPADREGHQAPGTPAPSA